MKHQTLKFATHCEDTQEQSKVQGREKDKTTKRKNNKNRTLTNYKAKTKLSYAMINTATSGKWHQDIQSQHLQTAMYKSLSFLQVVGF